MPDKSHSHSRASSCSVAPRSSLAPQPIRSKCFRLSHRRRQFRTSAMPAARVLSMLPGAGAILDKLRNPRFSLVRALTCSIPGCAARAANAESTWGPSRRILRTQARNSSAG